MVSVLETNQDLVPEDDPQNFMEELLPIRITTPKETYLY